MGRELRQAVRHVAKSRRWRAAAIGTLALGIGACTAMFSIVEAALLESMGVAQSQRPIVGIVGRTLTIGPDRWRVVSRSAACRNRIKVCSLSSFS